MPDSVDKDYYPPPAFHFKVTFNGVAESFQSVDGIEVTINVERVPEGGQDDVILPKGASYPKPLVLKRGVVGINSELVKWCKRWAAAARTGAEAKAETMDVVVSLLDGNQQPLHSWAFSKAYPVKWNLGTLDAQRNEVAVETIELTYQSFEWAA